MEADFEAHALIEKEMGFFGGLIIDPVRVTLAKLREVVEMKKLALWFFAVGLVLTFAGKSLAADTANVVVTATVLDTCLIVADGALAFGSIDPSLAGPYLPAVTEVNVQCGAGTGFAITDDGGNSGVPSGPYFMQDPTNTNNLTYTMSYDVGGFGAGFGTDVALNLAGSITQANAQAVPADVYDDTVLLTIAP